MMTDKPLHAWYSQRHRGMKHDAGYDIIYTYDISTQTLHSHRVRATIPVYLTTGGKEVVVTEVNENKKPVTVWGDLEYLGQVVEFVRLIPA